MLRRKMVRFSAVALIGFACVLATEARADFLGPITLPAPALTAPLSCTADVDGEGGTLIVTAGADGLAVPHDVTSLTNPLCPTGTTCSEYTYRFANSTSNISNAWLSISSDIVIYQAAITSPTPSPGGVFIGECLADKTPTNGLTACAQREVRFSPEVGSPAMDVKVLVSRSAPRVSTVGTTSVNLFHSGFCLIQGPGAPVNTITPIRPITFKSTLNVAHGKCPIDVTYGADGGFTSSANSAGSLCTEEISNSPPLVNGLAAQIPPGGVLTGGPNTRIWILVNGKYVSYCTPGGC